MPKITINITYRSFNNEYNAHINLGHTKIEYNKSNDLEILLNIIKKVVIREIKG